MNTNLNEQVEKLVAAPYTEVTTRDETTDGRPIFLMSHPELPGCMAQGATIDDARANLEDARREYILSLLEDGLNVPVPLTQVTQTVGAHPNIDKYQGSDQPTVVDDLSEIVQPLGHRQLGTVSPVTP